MPSFEYYPFLDGTRALLIAAASAYLVYALEGLVLIRKSISQDRSDILRSSLAIVMLCFCLIQFFYTFNFGNTERIHLLLPILYTVGPLAMLIYAHLFSSYMEGARVVLPLVRIFSLISITFSIWILIYYQIAGKSLGWELIRDDSITNTLTLASFGPYHYRPFGLGLIATISCIVATLIMYSGLVAGIISTRNTDGVIIIGILFSLMATFVEITMPLISSDYVVTLFFLSVIPELVRSSYLARKRLSLEVVNRERETILSLSATINHELNTPLAIISSSISLALLKNDVSKLKYCDETLFKMASIVKRLDDLGKGSLEKELYREIVEDGDKTKEIYSIGTPSDRLPSNQKEID